MRNDSEGGDMKQLTDEISCGKQKPSLNLSFQESIHNPLMTFSSDRSSSLFNKRELLLLSKQCFPCFLSEFNFDVMSSRWKVFPITK